MMQAGMTQVAWKPRWLVKGAPAFEREPCAAKAGYGDRPTATQADPNGVLIRSSNLGEGL